ncbi:periplasmic sensor signal transduction histidine kinase [Calothrix parasitica NIES-267]|uniref:histidine kinase n=1 Tax=Calothrix parasitica NIES-267 TaxID=1973488 RepID=A0A1Z4LQ13_9CYAN|nr:periplasmic sensor signal transduction histidine kinase [Calothrix parasitica NIES-267]
MNSAINVKNHPFKFLLYLEWVLLGFAAIASIVPIPLQRFPTKFPELTVISLAIFGLMGLRIPTNRRSSKIIYTACEIFLILITNSFGGRTSRLFPFLNLILVTRSCLIFKLPGRLVVAALSFSLFLFTFRKRFHRLPLRGLRQARPPLFHGKFFFFQFSFVLLFVLALVFVLLLMNAVLSERKSREKLAAANKKLRQYALKIENQATLEERNRIAREIHDSLGHSLTALNLQLETGTKLLNSNPEKAKDFLVRAKGLGSQALKDVRESVSTMRSDPLQEKFLETSINTLVENFHHSTNIQPNYQINLFYPIPRDVSTAIYRIIQESLTNISKYAEATEVNLEITTVATNLHLIIEDNGKGFDLTKNTTGFGLQSMRDRTLALEGDFNIESFIGKGTKIKIDIPLSKFSSTDCE